MSVLPVVLISSFLVWPVLKDPVWQYKVSKFVLILTLVCGSWIVVVSSENPEGSLLFPLLALVGYIAFIPLSRLYAKLLSNKEYPVLGIVFVLNSVLVIMFSYWVSH